MIKNYMETLVEQNLTTLLKTDPQYKNICTCNQCMDDIRAKALNKLPPMYITCKKGEIYGEFHSRDVQNKTDITAAVVYAVEFISSHAHSSN